MILYGLLFKAVAHDANVLEQSDIKLSYRKTLDDISQWAERIHHEYRRQFARLGGKVHSQRSPDGFTYVVLVTVRGRQEESVYNVEILRAECQVRLDKYVRRT